MNAGPRSLGNFFLLTGKNSEYLNKLVKFLPSDPSAIMWDDYYTRNFGNKGDGSSLWKAMKKYPMLMKALLLTAAMLLMYILFGGKRRQRIVPVIKPVENSSVKYAEALSGMYYREKAHGNIGLKMVNYFHEYLRTRYMLSTNHITDDYIVSLSRKSGYDLDKTKALYRQIRIILNNEGATGEADLLHLNEQIQDFLKNTN